MASIFDLPPLEEGGPIARAGFTYQDHVAAALCIEMVRYGEIEVVGCETHDDIILKKNSGGKTVVELVQVKSDELDQLWSVAKISLRKTKDKVDVIGSSILEKQFAKDRGDERAQFRIVTMRDANADLAILKQPRNARPASKLAALVSELGLQLGPCTSPKGDTLGYWVQNALWDVRESAQALENSNSRALEEYLIQIERPLLLHQRVELYTKLLNLVRQMAETRFADGPELKRVSCDDLRRWLLDKASAFPTAVTPDRAKELTKLERLSFARSEARWVALGVPENVARGLSTDGSVGAPPAQMLAALDRPFAWVIGDFGTGKSLMAERIFQQQLSVFQSSGNERIPVFFEAKFVSSLLLRDVVETTARKLGDPNRHGTLVIIDGIDEAGPEAALNLLSQAYALSRADQSSRVIVTSRPLAFDGYPGDRVELQPIPIQNSLDIVARVSGEKVESLHAIPEVFHSDIQKPLFAVLVGLALRERQQLPSSTAEMLAQVVDRALKPCLWESANAREALMRLAGRSSDLGGAPVRWSDIANSALELQPLLASRLVVENQQLYSFSVATISHWFAAESLRTGRTKVADLLNDYNRLHRWQYPLALFVGTGSFEQVAPVLEGLALQHPAFAGIVLAHAIRDWHLRLPATLPSESEIAQRILAVTSAWREGLGILGSAVLPCNSHGELPNLSVHIEARRITCEWHSESVGLGLEKQPLLLGNIGEVWSEGFGDQPAWVWRQIQSKAVSKLSRLLRDRAFFLEIGPLAHEMAWNEACERTVGSRFRDTDIPLTHPKLTQRRAFSDRRDELVLKTQLEVCRNANQESIRAPYPQADLPSPQHGTFGDHFSVERGLARIHAAFGAALIAYEQLIEFWFPKFAPRLRHCAVLPVRLDGILIPADGRTTMRQSYYYGKFLPLAPGTPSEVSFRIGTQEEGRALMTWDEPTRRHMSSMRPHASDWIGLFGFGAGGEEICGPDPCQQLVYRWLEQDLKDVKWL